MLCSARLQYMSATSVLLCVELSLGCVVRIAVLTPQVLSLVSGAYYTYVFHAYTKSGSEEMSTLKRHYAAGCVRQSCGLRYSLRVCVCVCGSLSAWAQMSAAVYV